MPKFCKILICLIGVFCICETKKNKNFLVVYQCPYSTKPITFEDFVKNTGDGKSEKKYWKPCLLPDYSCAKIRISGEKHIFTCLSDYGTIAPTFIENVKGIHRVGHEKGVLLTKGCAFLNDKNITGRTHTTLTYQNRTFVTELVCCKGDVCGGRNWKEIWGDGGSGRMSYFWYPSIAISATIFSLIASKISLIAYHRLKERLVINALKTISTTLAEADEEDKSKRRSAIRRMFQRFRCRRRKRKKGNLRSTSSERTNSVEALLKDD